MNLGELGTSGLLVTPIGLGLAALGRPGYINLGHAEDLERNYSVDAMRAHAHQVLDEAWRGGVRYFDAARSYGKAEEFLGSWLTSRQISPAEVTVGSKWGYVYTADWKVEAEKHEVKEHSLPVLERQWQESQANLAPYLRLYQIHSATQESGVLEHQAVLDRLAQLKSEGIAIGLTLSGPNQAQTLRQAMDVYIDGRRLFDSVQATWNLLEQSAGAALAEARAAGIGTIIKETLANGLLTGRNTDPAFAGKLSLLKSQAERLNTTIDALALAAVLAQPWADVVLSGAATPEQVRSNLSAVNITWDEQAAGLLDALRETPEAYWSRRSELDWA